MNASEQNGPWLGRDFFENREKFPRQELTKYAGRHIAWSWDGSRIVDSDEDDQGLWNKLVAAGIDPHHVVFSYVDAL